MEMRNIVDESLISFLDRVVEFSSCYGCRVALVGGCVRDILLGRKIWDVDIVVEGDAILFARKYFKEYIQVEYKYYRTCNLYIPQVGMIDLASAREEVYFGIAKRPVIRFASIEMDLFRRDFRINAMAVLLKRDWLQDFKVIDLYGGMDDLRNRRLDVLHDRSFLDDPIRILRGIRYCVRFNFEFSKRTSFLINQAKELSVLDKVDPNRIKDECRLMRKEGVAKINQKLRELLGLDIDILEKLARKFWGRR